MTSNSQHTSPLARLPPELFPSITGYLSTDEYNALRLTCKVVESKTIPDWAHRFFKARQFVITTFSLDALTGIARHPELCKALNLLSISVDSIVSPNQRELDVASRRELPAPAQDPDPAAEEDAPAADGSDTEAADPNDQPQQPEHGPSQPRADKLNAWHAAYNDQHWLLGSGTWVPRLAEAMALLPNLKTVALRNFCDIRSPVIVFSYGTATVTQSTPRGSTGLMHWDEIDRVFHGVLLAIIQSGITPRRFEIDFTGVGFVSDAGMYLPRDIVHKLRPFFTSLRSMCLLLPLAHPDMPNARTFLSHMKNLESLWVCGSTHHTQEMGFWAWLGDSACEGQPTATPRPYIPPARFPSLKSLTVEHCAVTVDEILLLVSKFGIRSLTLERCFLMDVQPSGPRVNLCSQLLKSLAGTSVRYLRIDVMIQLGQMLSGGELIQPYVCSVNFGNSDSLSLPSALYGGVDMFSGAAEDVRIEYLAGPL